MVGGMMVCGIMVLGMMVDGMMVPGIMELGIRVPGIMVVGTMDTFRRNMDKWNWNNGILNCDNEPSYWLDGGTVVTLKMEYGIVVYLEEKISISRFGTMAYNSRTAI
jgi:hypothetical protein